MNKKLAATAKERHRDKTQGTLFISAGLPGSGKTTFLNKNKVGNQVVVSRDDIRYSLLKEGEEYFSHEEEVFEKFVQKIVENIKAGRDVYADATHLTRASQIKLLAPILLDSAPPQISYIHFNVPLDVCLERNEKRKGTKTYVPREVIRKMNSNATFEPCSFIDTAWEVDKNGIVSRKEF